MSRCHGHAECPNTAGYYFGGGIWICWLHVLFDGVLTGIIARTGQKMQALPAQLYGAVQEPNRSMVGQNSQAGFTKQ